MIDREEFNRNVNTVATYAGDTPRNRKAASFLLSLAYCGNHLYNIVKLTRLSEPTVRKYLGVMEQYLTDSEHGFVCQWPGENGDISFVLDMLVIQGKITRRWDEQVNDFVYCAIEKQPSKARTDKYVTEFKYSARREGLIPRYYKTPT